MKGKSYAKINKQLAELEPFLEGLEKKVAKVFEPHDEAINVLSCKAEQYGPKTWVTVSRMYSYLPMNYAILKALAEAFGTENFEIGNMARSGCETCDHGSSYSHTFSFVREDLD